MAGFPVHFQSTMARVVFTPNLKRHLSVPTKKVDGRTLGEVLDKVFTDNSRLRGYVFDDGGSLRKHVVVFVDGRQSGDRDDLSDPVKDDSEIYVMQALSGGRPSRTDPEAAEGGSR